MTAISTSKSGELSIAATMVRAGELHGSSGRTYVTL
jgi:hypothetical protein